MADDLSGLFAAVDKASGLGVAANQYGPSIKRLGKGALVQFTYGNAKPGHDQNPLVILTDVGLKYFRGVNLHYLTFPVIRQMLQKTGLNFCNNPFLSYQTNIKSNEYIKKAFRVYKRSSCKRVKILDCNFILNAMGSVRALDPQDLEALRSSIKEQLAKTVNQNIPDMPQVET